MSSFRFCLMGSLLVLGLYALPAYAADPAPVSLQAPPASSPSPLDAARATPQGSFIQTLGDRAIAILSNKALSPEGRSSEFRAMMRESFDLPTIARFVIGRAWNSATPEQQADYLSLFEALVVKTYTDRFALYTGEGFGVRTVRTEGEHDFMVESEISHPDGSPGTSVNWRVRQKADKLGIIDVVVEGVSMSVTQRQEYSAVLQRNGGSIDALLNMMRQRVDSDKAAAARATKQANK